MVSTAPEAEPRIACVGELWPVAESNSATTTAATPSTTVAITAPGRTNLLICAPFPAGLASDARCAAPVFVLVRAVARMIDGGAQLTLSNVFGWPFWVLDRQ